MKTVKIIANPKSGRETALSKVVELVRYLSEAQYKIIINFTHKSYDATEYAKTDDGEDFIVVCGGDGTINEVVNGIYHSKRDIPLAILQSGTVNDFANALKLPTNVRRFYNMIEKFNTKEIDIGLAGDNAFINVAAGGLLTEIAYNVEDDLKARLGPMAYYIEGARELFKLNVFEKISGLNIKIDSKELKEDEEIVLFIIANSASVGGFRNLAPMAEVFDGYLDVLMVKAGIGILDLPELIRALLNGKHVDHNKVIYIKTKEIKMESDKDVIIDIDGERAGKLPMTFKVLEKALRIVVN